MKKMPPRQKHKLLILQKILMEQSDENHKLSGQDLIKKLEGYGINAERKTIYDDIATLQEAGVDVVTERVGHSNNYYISSRLFQDEELLVLADAVASSKFLTQKKSNELIKKLQQLTSRYKGQQLKRSIHVENRVKTYNESIYYSINAIHEAIYQDKKITFKYTEYRLDKKKHHRHHGEVYVVSPYRLVWENDCYYLVCYCQKHDEICRYRVDRMDKVEVSKEDRRVLSRGEEEITQELMGTYSMYGGTKENVAIEMSNKLINVVIDRFGESVRLRRTSEDKFLVNVTVQISPTFWGWLFGFGTDAEVLSPEWVKNEARNKLSEMMCLYTKNTDSDS